MIGASNFTAGRLSQALALGRERGLPVYQCLQPLYNLYSREEYEVGLEPICVAHGLGVIPYSSLASGFLTGKYRSSADLSKSLRGPRVEKYLDDRGFGILAALDRVSGTMGATPAQVALAWLLGRPSVTAPIVSATSVEQLKELIGATRLKLEGSQREILERAGVTQDTIGSSKSRG